MSAELLAPSQPRCGLCALFSPEGHPEHREAPRVGDYDYLALRRSIDRGVYRMVVRRLESNTHCPEKVRYRSRGEAERASRNIWNPSVHAYYCQQCAGWHVGKSDRVG